MASESEEITVDYNFKIVAIQAHGDDYVLLCLLQVPPECKMPSIKPDFKTDEERIGWEIGENIMKAMLNMGNRPPTPGEVHVGPAPITIIIPVKDYLIMGSPSVNVTILVRIRASVVKPATEA
jgi:hypothetical protein